jgi:hypothetical protein
MTPSVQIIYGIRPRKQKDYIHMHTYLVHHAMIQYSLKIGLKKFQNKGEEAVSKELLQLHIRDTFKPQDAKELSATHNNGALEYLMFLKEKRDGSLKGRTCADDPEAARSSKCRRCNLTNYAPQVCAHRSYHRSV